MHRPDAPRPQQNGRGYDRRAKPAAAALGRATPERLVRYPGASGYFSRLHYATEFARKVGMKAPILHGLPGAALLLSAVARTAENTGLVTAESRCRRPVLPGAELTAASRREAAAAAAGLTRSCRSRWAIAGAPAHPGLVRRPGSDLTRMLHRYSRCDLPGDPVVSGDTLTVRQDAGERGTRQGADGRVSRIESADQEILDARGVRGRICHQLPERPAPV